MLKLEELARNYPRNFVLRETAGLRQLFLDDSSLRWNFFLPIMIKVKELRGCCSMSISSKIKVSATYTRSVNLERDSQSGTADLGYIPTSRLENIGAIASRFESKDLPRAWSSWTLWLW